MIRNLSKQSKHIAQISFFNKSLTKQRVESLDKDIDMLFEVYEKEKPTSVETMHLSDFKTWDKTKFFSQHYAKRLVKENTDSAWSGTLGFAFGVLLLLALLKWGLSGKLSFGFNWATNAKNPIN